MKPKNFGQVKTAELHHFCDASEQGYGTASYLRFTNSMDEVHVAFVMGKSRIAPAKKLISIPRLKLMAAVVGVRLRSLIQRELDVNIDKVVLWSDSTSVLYYIHSQSLNLKTFVAHRVGKIQQTTEGNKLDADSLLRLLKCLF